MKIITIILGLLCAIFFSSCTTNNSNNKKEGISFSQENPKTELESIKELVSSNSATIIDVRTPEEFAEGHIENSINVPLNVIEYSLDSLKQYENIVVVCRSGGRSTKAKGILNNNGFTNVYNGQGWNSLSELLKK